MLRKTKNNMQQSQEATNALAANVQSNVSDFMQVIMHNYNAALMQMLAITQVLTGALSCIFGFCFYLINTDQDYSSYHITGLFGVVGGLLIFVTGLLGMISFKDPTSHCKHGIHMVLCIFSWLSALGMIVIYAMGFSGSLISSARTSVKYLFQLLFTMYPFILSTIKYKGFTLMTVAWLRSLTVTYPMYIFSNCYDQREYGVYYRYTCMAETRETVLCVILVSLAQLEFFVGLISSICSCVFNHAVESNGTQRHRHPYKKLQPECNNFNQDLYPGNRMKQYMSAAPLQCNQMDARKTKVKTKKEELLVIDDIGQ